MIQQIAPRTVTSFFLFADLDLDGYFIPTRTVVCSGSGLPAGYDLVDSGAYPDCDDTNASIAKEVSGYQDDDGDGYGVGSLLTQCVAPATSNPYAVEVGDCAPADGTRYRSVEVFADTDGDGYGAGAGSTECHGASIPGGYSELFGDLYPSDPNRSILQSYHLLGESGGARPLIKTDSAGNIYVVGRSERQFDADFGPGTTNALQTDMRFQNYILVYNSNMEIQKTFSQESPYMTVGQAVANGHTVDIHDFAVDAAGDIYLVGTALANDTYQPNFDFSDGGSLEPGIDPYARHLLVLKLDGSTGAPIWYKANKVEWWSGQGINSTNRELRTLRVAVSSSQVVVAGTVLGQVNVDGVAGLQPPTAANNYKGDLQGKPNYFVVSYDTDGTYEWTARSLGAGSWEHETNAVAFLPDGNVLINTSNYNPHQDVGSTVYNRVELRKINAATGAQMVNRNVTVTNGLEFPSPVSMVLTENYSWELVKFDRPDLSQTHLRLYRRNISDLTGVTLMQIKPADTQMNPDLDATFLAAGPADTVFIQTVGDGPLKFKPAGDPLVDIPHTGAVQDQAAWILQAGPGGPSNFTQVLNAYELGPLEMARSFGVQSDGTLIFGAVFDTLNTFQIEFEGSTNFLRQGTQEELILFEF